MPIATLTRLRWKDSLGEARAGLTDRGLDVGSEAGEELGEGWVRCSILGR